jgi:hypothetical protein
MRFRFEHGGRSSIRDPEALVFALEHYCDDGGKSGALLVDFAATNDQPGEQFRATHVMLHEMSVAIGAAREAAGWRGPDLRRDVWVPLANRYWAEGEATLLARTAPAQCRRRGRGSQSI